MVPGNTWSLATSLRQYHALADGIWGTLITVTDVHEQIASALWYHTIEIAPGLVTPGWFDLRPVLRKMPWPDVRGKRCLDIGTYDGFLAYEMEKRGASEVIAIDIEDHTQWDWPVDVRATGGENLAKLAGPEKSRGFKGSIQWDLEGSRGTRSWHVSIVDGRAVAAEGPADDASVKMHMSVPVFARVLARELDPARAMMEGKLEIEGDFAVAAQIGPMFGEDERW